MTRLTACASLLAVVFGCVCLAEAPQTTGASSAQTSAAQGQTQTAPDRTRIAVRHGIDPDASKIDRTPRDTTWAALLAVTRPADVTTEAAQRSRFSPFETTTWRITGTLTAIIHRQDGDFFMNVTDAQGGSGVVEVPDPTLCAGSPLLALIQTAREALAQKYHPTDTKQTVNDPIAVVGVGFFGWENAGGRGFGSTSRLMPGTGVEFK